jgi:hypothetical protein
MADGNVWTDIGTFGIHVPKGHVEVLEAAAENLEHVGHAADRASREMRHAAKVDGWEGSASNAFTATIIARAKPADIAERELPHGAKALRTLANELRQARRATKAAIEDATTAVKHQQAAERDAAEAQTKANNARTAASDLQGDIDNAAARGDHAAPIRHAQAELKHQAGAAEEALSQAKRRIAKAEDQLREAQQAGRVANDKYDHACQVAAKALNAVAATAPQDKHGDGELTWEDVDKYLIQPAKKGLPALVLLFGLGHISDARRFRKLWKQMPSWARLSPQREAELLARMQPGLNNKTWLISAAQKLGLGSRSGRVLNWLTDIARNPLMKKIGVAGGALSVTGDAADLYHDITDGNSSTASVANHITKTAFDVSSTAFIAAPNPYTAGATIVTGVAWLGTEAWEHWDDITHAIDDGWDAATSTIGGVVDDVGDFASDTASTLTGGLL